MKYSTVFLDPDEARIRAATKNLKRTDIARKLGVSPASVHRWMYAQVPVPLRRRAALLRVLGGSGDGLFVEKARAVFPRGER